MHLNALSRCTQCYGHERCAEGTSLQPSVEVVRLPTEWYLFEVAVNGSRFCTHSNYMQSVVKSKIF